MKLKGRHRPVQTQHKGNTVDIVPTGLKFRGCMIAVLVPQSSLHNPLEIAQAYVKGTNECVKKAKEVSVRDMVLVQVEAAKKLQEQMDGN